MDKEIEGKVPGHVAFMNAAQAILNTPLEEVIRGQLNNLAAHILARGDDFIPEDDRVAVVTAVVLAMAKCAPYLDRHTTDLALSNGVDLIDALGGVQVQWVIYRCLCCGEVRACTKEYFAELETADPCAVEKMELDGATLYMLEISQPFTAEVIATVGPQPELPVPPSEAPPECTEAEQASAAAPTEVALEVAADAAAESDSGVPRAERAEGSPGTCTG